MMLDVSAMPPADVWKLALSLNELTIFGPWETDSDGAWWRPEPSRLTDSLSRVAIYAADSPHGTGEVWCFDCFVRSEPGNERVIPSDTEPAATAEEAKAFIDSKLRTLPNTILVD